MRGDQAVQSNEPPDYLAHFAHQKVRNVPQGPLSLRFSGTNLLHISSLALFMRNPDLAPTPVFGFFSIFPNFEQTIPKSNYL